MQAILNWLDDRTGYRALVHEALNEPIPGGAKWKYVWGSTLTFVFGALQYPLLKKYAAEPAK